MLLPQIDCNDQIIVSAWRIAMGDIAGNVVRWKGGGLAERGAPVLLAGLDYGDPWTRDAAIHAWNGLAMVDPELSRSTLLAVLEGTPDRPRIGGQFWDSAIWALGAWQHFLITEDREFLGLAFKAVQATLEFLHSETYDDDACLYRGQGVYADGISAYPDAYTHDGNFARMKFRFERNTGRGPRVHALSTNVVYTEAWRVLGRMAEELGVDPGLDTEAHAARVEGAVREAFWDRGAKRFRYLLDEFGGCESQEGMGIALAALLRVAAPEQISSIFARAYVAPAGIPCLWPPFERYLRDDEAAVGRHCGTVWPPIQALWAEAAARSGRTDLFAHELYALAQHINRDGHCSECYHPRSGAIDGGLQEATDDGGPITRWPSMRRQSWSATGFMRMILFGLSGYRIDRSGITKDPCILPGVTNVSIKGLWFRGERS